MGYTLFVKRTFRLQSQGSSVGIVMGYKLDSWVLIPGRGKNFIFSTVSRLALGPTEPPIQWVLAVISLGIKWPGCEAVPPLPQMSSWNSA
jgi:hypothetical protein